ncbi:MAG: hypothetical protein B6I17_01910 [Tenericutes bacterium 4572_104]|nr:MAG: hypothetical protein B6I17_01910 [Tenericutes bacterium 4572_104]
MFKRILIFTFTVFALIALTACGQAKFELPDLTGLDPETAENLFTESAVTVSIAYEESETIPNMEFVRYGDDLQMGDKVEEGTTVTIYFSINYPELPDLTNKSKDDIETILDELDLNYDIQYLTNNDIDENYFISYGENDQVGDTIRDNHEIIVYIATSKLVLPDMTGMNQTEMISTLLAAGIDFKIEIVTDNDVPDQTFSGYGDGLEPGDLIPTDFEVTVLLGYNSQRLPDLTGMMKEQITKVLDDENISYEFNYVVNDDFAEDLFMGYQDQEVGDYYLENTVVVNLYKNTFTDDETSLFISKYLDGGDDTFDQAIEIYNPTTSNVDLSDYHLVIYANGSYNITYSIDLGDVILEPGETYLVANLNANSEIIAKADMVSDNLNFDGNDVIQLCYLNGTYIDTIYNIGNKDFVMDNLLYIRDASIVKGERIYAYNEWHGYVTNYLEVLGTFPIDTPYEVPFEFIDLPFNEGGMDNVVLDYINDGDTASFIPGFLSDKRVRFLGVDTPETYPVVDPWGPEAKAYTTFILNHAQDIYIQSDPDIGYWGNYGRSLGLVWVYLGEEDLTYDILSGTGEIMRTEHLSGWILLNYHLVLNGYSYNYYGEDTTLTIGHRYIYSWFQDAEKYASENGLGVHE